MIILINLSGALRQKGRTRGDREYRAEEAMGFMPILRSQNTSTASSGNRAESISAVLSEVQA